MKKILKGFIIINVVVLYVILVVIIGVAGYRTLTADGSYYVSDLNKSDSVTDSQMGGDNTETESEILVSYEEVFNSSDEDKIEEIILTEEEAKELLAQTLNCKTYYLVYYDDRTIEGREYYTFLFVDEGGGASDILYIVDKISRNILAYDVFGNIDEITPFDDDRFNNISEDYLAKIENVKVDDSTIQIYNNGSFGLKYYNFSMSFDEVVNQALYSNGIVADAPSAYSGKYPTKQSGDSGQGDDMTGIVNQRVYDMRCSIQFNFDHTLDSEYASEYTRQPYLEEIRVYFHDMDADTTFSTRDRIALMLGEPDSVSEFGGYIIYHWHSECGDLLNLTYVKYEGAYRIKSMRLDSIGHKQRQIQYVIDYYSNN